MKLNLTAQELGALLATKTLGKPGFGLIQEVAYDTRHLPRTEGVVFFGLKGGFRHGNEYVTEAYQKGIRYFVLDTKPAQMAPDACYFIVQDTLLALQDLAAFHRSRIKYPILAITGSIGKTTVKEWLAHLLADQLKVFRSPKSFNSQLGVALSLLALPLDGDLGIIEVAVTKPGEMERLQAMIAPNACLITNQLSGNRHEFESNEAYQDAFMLLAKSTDWYLDGHQISVDHQEMQQQLFAAIPFTDPVRIFNAKLAILAALHFGPVHASAVASLPVLANRLETIEGIDNATLVNDSYTLDLNAFEGSISFMKSIANGKPLMVCCVLDAKHLHAKSAIIALLEAQQIAYFIWENIPTKLPDITNHCVLIKTSSQSQAEILLAKWKRKSHSTQVHYDLSALRHNLRQYQQKLAPHTKVLAMVKAQAYGAGIDHIARQLELGGIQYFGVAYADEGVLLRQAGVQLPILVMNAEPGSFETCISNELEPAIYSLDQLDAFIRALIAQEKWNYPIHLKFDTGMHRLGFLAEQTDRIIQTINAQPEVYIRSVYSHMACADDAKHPFNLLQIERFDAICAQLQQALPYSFLRHLLNSEGAAHFQEAQYDMVRLGIGLFGINHHLPFEATLKPVVSWNSRISQLKTLQAGACVGYGCTDCVTEVTQIAIIPVGYADGFKRNLGNGKGGVYIDGQYCPTIGRVCMDMIMVLAPNVRPEAEVEIIGPHQTLLEFAQRAQTIPYEILTSISSRVQRIYIND